MAREKSDSSTPGKEYLRMRAERGSRVKFMLDNCTLLENADQRDTDGDGFGNRCDAGCR